MPLDYFFEFIVGVPMFGFNNNKVSVVTDLKKIENEIRAKARDKSALAEKLRKLAKDVFSSYPHDAVRLMRDSNELAPNVSKEKWIGFRLLDLGNLDESYGILSKLPAESFTSPSEKRRLRKLVSDYNSKSTENLLLEQGGTSETGRKVQCQFQENSVVDIQFCSTQKFFRKSDKTLGVICDKDFWDDYSDTANFIFLSSDECLDKVDSVHLDLILVASPWLGIDSSWYGVGFPQGDRCLHDSLVECLRRGKNKGIPIAFFALENCAQFNAFSDYAELADFVYVSDRESLSLYSERCTSAKVSYLPCGFNPLLFNPVGFQDIDTKRGILYAGVWNAGDKRKCGVLADCFEELNDLGIKPVIVDTNTSGNSEVMLYSFPEVYKGFVTGSAQGLLLSRFFKSYPLNLAYCQSEANSARLPQRFFELLASGCLVFVAGSGNSELSCRLPMVYERERVSAFIGHVSGSAAVSLYERRLSGIRTAMDNTVYMCINRILSDAGLEPQFSAPKVLVTGSDSLHNRDSFARQSYVNKYFVPFDKLTSEMLREYDAVAWFGDDIFYDSCYLKDMLNSFKFTDAVFVTKDSYLTAEGGFCMEVVRRTEHNFTSVFRDKNKTVFWVSDWDSDELLKISPSEQHPYSIQPGRTGYATDHASMVVGYEQYLKFITRASYRPYRISVLVPLQGDNIGSKCMRTVAALEKSASFNDTEVVFVIGASEKDRFSGIMNFLPGLYHNVRFCFTTDDAGADLISLGDVEPVGEYLLLAKELPLGERDFLTDLVRETREADFDAVLGCKCARYLTSSDIMCGVYSIPDNDGIISCIRPEFGISGTISAKESSDANTDEPVLVSRDFLNRSGISLFNKFFSDRDELMYEIVFKAEFLKFTDVM